MSTATGESSSEQPTQPDLLDYFLAHWKWLFVSGFLFGALGLAHALTSKPLYRADVTLAYVEDRQSISGLAGLASQFGGLASLAGINLGDPGSAKYEALGILQSRQLTADFIARQELMKKFYAGRWDEKTKTWRLGLLSRRAPTLSDAIKVFDRRVRKVNVDPKSGLISVSIIWGDPREAANWANALVADANNRLRERSIQESEERIAYLRKEISDSGLIGVHESLNRLMESEIKSISIARTREDYAFRVVDPARIPEPHENVSPQPLAEMVMGGVVGGSLAIVYLVLRLRRQRRRSRAT
jgi:uncharacterized protein involved in exopolysaccharide biosynthesis